MIFNVIATSIFRYHTFSNHKSLVRCLVYIVRYITLDIGLLLLVCAKRSLTQFSNCSLWHGTLCERHGSVTQHLQLCIPLNQFRLDVAHVVVSTKYSRQPASRLLVEADQVLSYSMLWVVLVKQFCHVTQKSCSESRLALDCMETSLTIRTRRTSKCITS